MEVKELSAYCLSCPNPRCETGCPTGNHIRDFIRAMKEDHIDEAADILYDVNPFPELTSRLCDCERQCQGKCVRGIRGEPVSIQQIERYISDHSTRTTRAGSPNGHSVALIGAGPACLAAARDLCMMGYQTEIYEKLHDAGGAILSGIPDYRFDKKHVSEIRSELEKAGVKFFFDCEVGKDISLEALLEKYDRVLVGIGAQKENRFGLKGEGCEPGLSLLYNLNIRRAHDEYRKKYSGAVVWGGGNVAMDCARSLVRILDQVTVIYRRSEKEMPANREEIEAAKKEGVKFAFLENIKELKLDENGKVIGAHCIRMHLGEPDASGRARPIETEGSDYEIPCELVVPAIGQSVDFSALMNLKPAENHHTDINRVYVTGDAWLGPKTVAAAIRDGRAAAEKIDQSFSRDL